MRLAIITTHPIQYYAPVFQLLARRKNIEIKVFYTWGEQAQQKFDPGFGKTVAWDIPLLDGYPFVWVENTSAHAGSHHFKGVINPYLIANIEEFKPDAMLVIGWAYDSHLKIIRYFKNKLPVYFRGDSTLLDRQTGVKFMLKSLYLKWLYKHINHAFYVGTNSKNYFKKYGLKDSQLTFAPHAIDNERFAMDRYAEAGELRTNLHIPNDAILILFAGKFEVKKDPQLLLNAFIALNQPNTHLLFVGNGHLEAELKSQASTHVNIHFIDFQNQAYMPVIYQACDIFCLPSKGPNETWGLAVNEAMASGRAILVSDRCGCAIDLVNSKNGIIFKSGNIEQIILGLRKLAANKSKLTKMGQQSAGIITDWSFEHIATAIENKLLNEKN
jgi:glycosyltransferase involved in cell wall biosynthesis